MSVDNAKLTELHIPENCFPALKYMSIQSRSVVVE